MTFIKKHSSRFLTDYGMSIVLLLLCIYFSIATTKLQQPSGAAAARSIAARLPGSVNVVVITRGGLVDSAFTDAIISRVRSNGGMVISHIAGSPVEAREALENLVASNQKVDAIVTTSEVAALPLVQNIPRQFPSLASVPIISPRSAYWPTFLNGDNLLNITSQVAVIALIAVGMTLVIITGGIDLSVGSLVALVSVVVACCIRAHGGTDAGWGVMIGSALGGILVCALVGLASGLLITLFRLPSFIVTLGMMQIAAGEAKSISNGNSIYDIPASFTWLGRGASILGIPNAVLIMVIVYVIAHVAMTRTKFGRYVYATGGNMEAARLSGVRTHLILVSVYTLSAALAGVGGIVVTSQLKTGDPTLGVGYELSAITAVVVGGTSLIGGSGKILGTLIGALIIAVMQNGMNLTGIDSYTQQKVLGIVLLAAVISDSLRRTRWKVRRSS
jgi:ribose transport system permease protein